jgi:dTDP-4-dehydrorhamnose 3,5-epimerase
VKRAPRVGVFGLLGSGNLGNDGSLEAVLGYLRAEYPDAVLSALVGGPELVRERYGLDTTPLHWNQSEYETASGLRSVVLKGFGKLVDIARTAAWVRKQDVVIVPGMGVLEATLPLRPWGFPYSLFLLSATGRLFGTKVALVCVGANEISARATRTLVRWSGRLAAYRSYRDDISRDAMRAMGVDTSADRVYPDLAFSLPTPDATGAPGTVGVGVMAYYGGNDDRADGDRIYRHYVDTMNRFVAWLVDQGRPVRLFIGDRIDRQVVDEIIEKTASPLVTAASAETLDELMHEMAAVDSVVATRYHNVLCALVRTEERRAHGGDGPRRLHPAGEDRPLRPARRAVHRTGEPLGRTAPDAPGRERDERATPQGPVRRPFGGPLRGWAMKAIPVPEIDGAYLFEPTPHADQRGFFSRTFDRDVVASVGIDPDGFVQDSLSRSRKGVVRGMHLRGGAGEAKLVRCSHGAVFDVVVDLRPDSPTFRNIKTFELSGDTQVSVYIPAGCAHGFQSLTDPSDVSYRIDRAHDPAEDITISYKDPELDISWPLSVTMVSDRDERAPSLGEALKPTR